MSETLESDWQWTMAVSRSSVEYTKKRLWRANRHLKSSHLTDAIARAAGYSTHAELLAACDAGNHAAVTFSAADIHKELVKAHIKRSMPPSDFSPNTPKQADPYDT